ncbi:MAG: alpha-glucosidase [Candidatus Cohnella colombiensis]|uniref:Alpha-glucosidase n=1 Tax=Candidatus Cohnella colombiensis TaxID=3121368 RepID=A0AA95EUL5_9BACL|nr:MAG: alpha-glucosidase [Cohnella sp.]
MNRTWWKESVAYQIYPRSFMDSNGDGIGDLQGIIAKLDYLQELGIDVIWLCPIYQSPNDDNGYDISDYRGVMSEFGTMEDFDQLLREVHARKMKVIIDLVINHTSDEHPWFLESRASMNNDKRDYYIWRDPVEGGVPNNWESIFGGSAWELDEASGQYFLHIFSRKQPDLNWENDAVRQELYEMVNWWLDKGIDGFRIDAISHIKKLPGLPDLPNPNNLPYVPSFDGHMNREGIHEWLQELKTETFSKYDIMTVGEANGVKIENVEDVAAWVGEENGNFNMVFQFEHLGLWNNTSDNALDLVGLKRILSKWQNGMEGVGWNALFIENHDLPRSVSTLGNDGEYRVPSAKALATMYFLMKGTPFIYQGQELGMTNLSFDSIEDFDDKAQHNHYRIAIENGQSHEQLMRDMGKTTRDNSRTPMQWDASPNAGFSSSLPWFRVNPNYADINVKKDLADSDSIYHFYKRLIRLRKENEVAVYGAYDLLLEEHEQIFAYTRTMGERQLLVIVNMSSEECRFALPEAVMHEQKLLLSNYAVEETVLSSDELTFRPYEARVYLA